MPINNPAGEQHREQLKIHVEELQQKINGVVAELTEVFGPENFSVDQDGNVSCPQSDLELGEERARARTDAEKKLRGFYGEIKKIDPDIWRESLGKVH